MADQCFVTSETALWKSGFRPSTVQIVVLFSTVNTACEWSHFSVFYPSLILLSIFPEVPAGSPSRGGDSWACPLFFFILFLCLFPSLWLFQLYFIPYSLPTTRAFSLRSSGLISASLVLYIFLYESLPQPWYTPLCLTGLKAPTNQQTNKSLRRH